MAMSTGTAPATERFSVLQKLGFVGAVLLGLLVAAGLMRFAILGPSEKPFYVPGQVPSRDACFYGKLAEFKNINRQILFQVGQECEIEVQSLEGHEQMRQEWFARQAERARERAAQPAAPVAEEPAEADRVRRVWR